MSENRREEIKKDLLAVSENRREEIESPPRLERVQARTDTRPLCESELRQDCKSAAHPGKEER